MSMWGVACLASIGLISRLVYVSRVTSVGRVGFRRARSVAFWCPMHCVHVLWRFLPKRRARVKGGSLSWARVAARWAFLMLCYELGGACHCTRGSLGVQGRLARKAGDKDWRRRLAREASVAKKTGEGSLRGEEG